MQRPSNPLMLLFAFTMLTTLTASCAARTAAAGEMDEGKIFLKSISDGARSYAEQGDSANEADPEKPRGHFPSTPSEVCTTTGGTGQPSSPNQSEFMVSPWRDLFFSIQRPHMFRYCYQSDGQTFTATATNGDLKLQVKGTIEDKDGVKVPVITPAEPVSK